MNIQKKLQIFVSSTYLDLKKERQAAVEAILEAGHIPAGMELFAAGSDSQLQVIKNWIEESDIYMLILGGRYGSVEENSGMSYTELEYRYALELEKPLFALIAEDSYVDEKLKEDGGKVIERDNPDRWREFKATALSKMCKSFASYDQIKLGVFQSIMNIQSRQELVGWVKASEVPDVSLFASQISELREENERVKEQLRVLETGRVDKIGDYSFEELCESLEKIKVTIPKEISASGKERPSDILELTIRNRERLATGVANRVDMSESDRFLYFSVLPHLRIFELAQLVRIDGVAFTRIQTSSLGNKFIAGYLLKFPDSPFLSSKSVLNKRNTNSK